MPPRILFAPRRRLLFAGLIGLPMASRAAPATDLPACEAILPVASPELSIGIVQPGAADDLLRYAVELTRQSERISVCSESWSVVLPHWVPWASQLERGYGFVFFVLALIAAIGLLHRFTPRVWWQRTTLLGLLAMLGAGWLGGVTLLGLFHLAGGQRLVYDSVVSLRVPGQASDAWHNLAGARALEATLIAEGYDRLFQARPLASVAPPVAKPMPDGRYVTYHRLNLRERAGTEAPRLTTLPTGTAVSFDGAVEGDWWKIKAASGKSGWASSLWLRRPEEKAAGKG